MATSATSLKKTNIKQKTTGITNPENISWNISYQISKVAEPSWAKHGMPHLFKKFLGEVKKSKLHGFHLDIGCGNGEKTVVFADCGLNTIGVDQSDDGFDHALVKAKELNVLRTCRFFKSDCTEIPLPDNSVSSASDILMSTHLKPRYWKRYLKELDRLMQPGANLLLVFFSDKDQHFHGHPVSKSYTFSWKKSNRELEKGDYSHYENMYNFHISPKDLDGIFGSHFDVVAAGEFQHPVYPHRKLVNAILRKKRSSNVKKSPIS